MTQLRIGQLLDIFIDICHATEFAHSKQVIHRDLKPGNIMLGSFGEVLVMDWGSGAIAIRVESEFSSGIDENPAPPESESTVSSTLDGYIRVPAYMAPEQASGRVTDIDERTDGGALGGILYEMLTLHEPIEGEKSVRSTGKWPPERRIPKDLAAIAMKALSLIAETAIKK